MMFRKHPETKFIDAHLGWYGNDLGKLGKLFDELPKRVHRKLGAVLAELGRQPSFARQWIIQVPGPGDDGEKTRIKKRSTTHLLPRAGNR